MKKLTITILLMLTSVCYVQSQDIHVIEFEDGTKKEISLHYNNPSTLPKIRVYTGFIIFNTNLLGGRGIIPYNFNLEYRPDMDVNFEVYYSGAMAKEADEGIADYELPSIKLYRYAYALAHLPVYQFRDKIKEESIYAGSSDGKSYYIKFPKIYRREVVFDFGVSMARQAIGDKFIQTSPKDYTYIANQSSISIQSGLSYRWGHSYKITSNDRLIGKKMSYNSTKVYFNLTAAVSNKATFFEAKNDVISEVDANSVANINKQNFGLKFGFKEVKTRRNGGSSWWYGVEYAKIPSLSFNNYGTTSSGLIRSFWGIGFGSKP